MARWIPRAAAFLVAILLAGAAAAQAPEFGDQVFFEDDDDNAPAFAADEGAGGPASPGSLLKHGQVVPDGVTTIVRLSSPQRCTATLIGRRTLLTAAHCLKTANGSLTPNITLTLASSASASGRCAHPATYPANKAHDWAVCLLGREVRNVRFERIDAAGQIHVNDQVVLTGFGCTEAGASDGKLRYGFASIANPSSIPPGPAPGLIGTAANAASASLCPGDSGGPVFRFFGANLSSLTWNACRRQIATNTSVLPTMSFYAPLNREASQTFLKGWAQETGQSVCGLNTSDQDPACRC